MKIQTLELPLRGLAGLYYGLESIPEDWLLNLARYDDIKSLIEKMARRYLD
ncbi:hypothetical protein KUH03_08810 [Sphingobacterium sp. E70]|uniref:hypothetical protein n=1 Tax=Sphingobacterium sp. E70 TaxID=2853439 RepID=UPI00211B8F9E|nr:hypothetical protein [Sphingobacterium sp. E70]ULT26907.1 hypothetical protein KUH03_08810 [Sphingobacterium sp. E70]